MNRKLTSRAALSVPFLCLLTLTVLPPAAAAPARMGHSGSMMSVQPAAMVLQQMHMVNQFEIKAATVARQKATKTPVKRYADRLWRDHHVADTKVMGLAQKLGFNLKSPAQMQRMMMQMKQKMQQSQMGSMGGQPSMQQPPMSTGRQSMQKMQKMQQNMQMMQQTMMKLKSASGSQFDKAYIMAMIKGHQKAIHMLEQVQALHKLNQPQVIGLIGKLLPILKQHLELAEHLQASMAR